jgi:hypothetical protein
MDWVESGRAWGARATDWVYLLEPYARSANDALFDRTGRPGVAEQMLKDAGLEFADRGTVQVISELPDLDLTVRALAAAGPSRPAIHPCRI